MSTTLAPPLTRQPARRVPARRYLNVLINLTLLCLVVVSFVTGWVTSLLGLTEFGLHKYSSIALILVASGHVVLHWRSLTTQLRNLGTNRYDRRNAAQRDRRSRGDRRANRASSEGSDVARIRLFDHDDVGEHVENWSSDAGR